MDNEYQAWKDFQKNDIDFSLMRIKYSDKNFYERYNIGFESYINGDWKNSKKYLDEAESILGSPDGPIQYLKSKMEKYNYEMPENYKF